MDARAAKPSQDENCDYSCRYKESYRTCKCFLPLLITKIGACQCCYRIADSHNKYGQIKVKVGLIIIVCLQSYVVENKDNNDYDRVEYAA